MAKPTTWEHRLYKASRKDWYVRFESHTHAQNGRSLKWSVTSPRDLMLSAGITTEEWLSANVPAEFRGCDVHYYSTLAHRVYLIEPDYPHKCQQVAID